MAAAHVIEILDTSIRGERLGGAGSRARPGDPCAAPRPGGKVRDRPDTPFDRVEPEALHGSEDAVHRLRRAGRLALRCLATAALLVAASVLLVRP